MRSLLILLVLAPLTWAGDTVTLKNGDSLKGKVVGLTDSLVRFTSPFSKEPLEILNETLQELSFEKQEESELPIHSHQVNLRNGDIIPCKVTALDDKNLSVDTWFAGPLSISRSQIESVFYSMAPQPLVFQGPTNIDSWNTDGSWSLNQKTLQANDRGNISRNVNLPEQFIAQFNLSWKSSPNFRFHFCTTADTGTDSQDGYYLAFNNQGAQLHRVLPPEDANGKPKFQALGSSLRKATDFKELKAQIELRVDRTSRRIILYLNGEKQQEMIDPHSAAPTGKKIIFENLSSGSRRAIIENLEIRKWDAVTQHLRREPRSKKDTDSLSTSEGDRYSGSILKLSDIDGTLHYEVKSPLSETLIKVPENHCAAVYFSEKENKTETEPLYNLSFIAGGALSLSDINLSDDALSASHPWLGKLKLDRRIIREITRRGLKKEEKESAKATTKKPSIVPQIEVQVEAAAE